jgi:hypothetical protein
MLKHIKALNPCTEWKKINCRYEIFHRCFSKSILIFHICSYCNMVLDMPNEAIIFNVKTKLSVTLNIVLLFDMEKKRNSSYQHNVE